MRSKLKTASDRQHAQERIDAAHAVLNHLRRLQHAIEKEIVDYRLFIEGENADQEERSPAKE